jgi:hypothetical protein
MDLLRRVASELTAAAGASARIFGKRFYPRNVSGSPAPATTTTSGILPVSTKASPTRLEEGINPGQASPAICT